VIALNTCRSMVSGQETFRMGRPLGQTDWHILAELQRDGRLSYKGLARRVNLSSPAVAERVRRLEEAASSPAMERGSIPARAGVPLTAFVQPQCALGSRLLKTTTAEECPRGHRGAQAERQLVPMPKVRRRVDATPGGTAQTPRQAR
jgi:hypothetical protein